VIVNQTSPLTEGELSELDSYVRSGHSVLIVRSIVSAAFNVWSSDELICTIKVIGGCDPFEATANSTYFKYSRSVLVKGTYLKNLPANVMNLLSSKKVWVDRDKNGRRTEADTEADKLAVMVGQTYGRGRVIISSVEFFEDALLTQLDNKLFVKELFSWLSSPSLAVKKYGEVGSKLGSFLGMRGDLERVGGNSSVLLKIAASLNRSLNDAMSRIDRGLSEEAIGLLDDIDKRVASYMSFVSRLVVIETKLAEFSKYLEETKASEPNITLDTFFERLSKLNSEKKRLYEKWSAGDIAGANQTASYILDELEKLRSETVSNVTAQKEKIRQKQEEQQRIMTLAIAALITVIVVVAAISLHRRRKREEKVEVVIRPPGS
ncbi:MAG: hypothetical protein NZ992_06845, partial [Candidatus Korarchaeum sp.]|nr:hypothetical protein [Candidatus Korarchaeum sp.]MDW8035902.1 hypothetical protein [Candidatus Korarchaeum sp.]